MELRLSYPEPSLWTLLRRARCRVGGCDWAHVWESLYQCRRCKTIAVGVRRDLAGNVTPAPATAYSSTE